MMVQSFTQNTGILECEVKGVIESVTMNKANGGDGIQAELFKIIKDNGAMNWFKNQSEINGFSTTYQAPGK